MNSKVIIGLVVIIIIAAGAYLLVGQKGMPGSNMASSTPQATSGQSLQSLAASGQPVTCTFATTTAAGTTQGTIYVANGMVAGDFTTSGTQTGSIESHMITRDNTSYVWTSMSSQGFKTTISNTQTQQQSQGIDYNTPNDYHCSPWTADSSKFNLPANISFTASASFTPTGTSSSATGATNSGAPKGTPEQCASCNSLSGAQKAQCLAALQC